MTTHTDEATVIKGAKKVKEAHPDTTLAAEDFIDTLCGDFNDDLEDIIDEDDGEDLGNEG